MKVAVDFELLKAYLPEHELVKITEELNTSRENHRLYMRKKREQKRIKSKMQRILRQGLGGNSR
jgi:hypothetical protein